MQHGARKPLVGLPVGALVFGAGRIGVRDDEEVSHELNLVTRDETDHAVGERSDETGRVYADGRTADAGSDLGLARFNGPGEYGERVTVDGDSTAVTHTSTRATARSTSPTSVPVTKTALPRSRRYVRHSRPFHDRNACTASANSVPYPL